MVQKKRYQLFIAIFILIFAITSVYGTKSFNVAPDTLSESMNVGSSGYRTFTIQNTGDENISLNISSEGIKKGTSSISLSFNQTDITDLEPNKNVTIKVSYTSQSTDETGDYFGQINVMDKTNSSINKTVNLTVTLTSLVSSFSVTPLIMTDTVTLGDSSSKIFTIQNTGNENISLNVSSAGIQKGTATIGLSFNQSDVTNLEPNKNVSIKVSYTAQTSNEEGLYFGQIKIVNKNNASMYKNANLSVTVINDSNLINCLVFDNEGTTLNMKFNVDDSSESKTFVLRNICHKTIENIRVRLHSKLEGVNHNDDIDRDDVKLNEKDGDEWYDYDDDKGTSFSLDYNETTDLKVKLDIPSNLDVDDYKADLEFEILSNESSTYQSDNSKFTLRAEAYSDDDDVYIEDNLYVKSRELSTEGEPGDTIDDLEIRVKNDEYYDVDNVVLKVKDDLEEEDSANTIDKANVIFKEENFSISDRDYEDVKLDIKIPDGTPTGTYYGKIELYDKNGNKKDDITLKVKVIGDIYISKIEMPDKVIPDSDISVKVYVKNHGTKSYSNVKVYATIFDIDYGYSDLSENTNTFILDAGEEKSYTLRFHIPKRATDGSHNIEIRTKYDDKEFKEKKEIEVDRPVNNVVMDSFGINPPTIKCDKMMYGFIKYENLGKYDDDVITSMEIEGTDLKDSSKVHKLRVDQVDTDNFNLDVLKLKPGTYNVIFKINADNKISVHKKILTVLNCSNSMNIDVKPIVSNKTTTHKNSDVNKNTIELFGKKLDKTTVYLGGGVGITFIGIIIVGLFLL